LKAINARYQLVFTESIICPVPGHLAALRFNGLSVREAVSGLGWPGVRGFGF